MAFTDLVMTGDVALRGILGGSLIYTPGTGSPVTVKGIFDQAYVRLDTGEAGIASASPAAFFTLSDLPSDPSADVAAQVTALGVTYRITEAKPDGIGAVIVFLQEV